MSNVAFEGLSAALVLIEIALAIWGIRRRNLLAVVRLNAVLAAAVLFYWVPDIGQVIATDDGRTWALLGFEGLALTASLARLFGTKIPAAVIWAIFAVHLAMSALLALIAFTFRINRLI